RELPGAGERGIHLPQEGHLGRGHRAPHESHSARQRSQGNALRALLPRPRVPGPGHVFGCRRLLPQGGGAWSEPRRGILRARSCGMVRGRPGWCARGMARRTRGQQVQCMGKALWRDARTGRRGRVTSAHWLSEPFRSLWSGVRRALPRRASARASLLATFRGILLLLCASPLTSGLAAQSPAIARDTVVRLQAPDWGARAGSFETPSAEQTRARVLESGRYRVIAFPGDERLARSLLAQASASDSFPGMPRPTAPVVIAVA